MDELKQDHLAEWKRHAEDLKLDIETLRGEVERLRAEAGTLVQRIAEGIDENERLQIELRAAQTGMGARQGTCERLRALLNDKQYIQLLADYNRGHLSHYGWLKKRDGGLGEEKG
jgi:regulator of replication initiation timing